MCVLAFLTSNEAELRTLYTLMGFTIYYITWKPICTNYKSQLDDKNRPSGSARGRWVEWMRGEPKISEFSQSATFSSPSKTHSNPLLPACQPVCLAPEMKYSWQPWIFIYCLSSYQQPAVITTTTAPTAGSQWRAPASIQWLSPAPALALWFLFPPTQEDKTQSKMVKLKIREREYRYQKDEKGKEDM